MTIKNAAECFSPNVRACVIGIGISNIPLIGMLLDAGVKVEARDAKASDKLSPEVQSLANRGLALKCGERYLDGIDADIIFRSPGLRPDLPEIEAAVKRGALLSSEMELFFELCPAFLIGITGSDGKTTTTSYIYSLLSEMTKRAGRGRVYVGGNIGAPLLPLYREMTSSDFAVAELSSFQLMTMKKSPDTSVITNITPNHLNWHTGMAEYTEAKTNIYRNGASRLVANLDNDITRQLLFNAGCERIGFSRQTGERGFCDTLFCLEGDEIKLKDKSAIKSLIKSDKILLPGLHNRENLMAAAGAVYGLFDDDIFIPSLTDVAHSFGGVEHRLEFVRNFRGVDYYNSSIDSSPTRTAAALSSFDDKSVVICGGCDKKIPFGPLAETLCVKARASILTGATMEKIYNAILSCPLYPESGLEVIRESDFTKAVYAAREAAKGYGRVILSPACTSFDLFNNFEERGKFYKKIVKEFN